MKTRPRLSISGCRDGAGFRPTFPLDDEELRDRVLGTKLRHPGSWAIPVGCGFALSLLSLSTGLYLGLLFGLSACWLHFLWRRIDAAATSAAVDAMVGESNRCQNERMIEVIRIFRTCGAGHYAEVMVNFLGAKRRCEKEISDDPGHVSTVETMENLVDGLCSSVCDELDRLVKLDRKLGGVLVSRDPILLDQYESDRSDRLVSVMQAYSVISDTAETLEGTPTVIATSGSATFEPETDEMDNELIRSIEDLRYETDIKRRVNERLAWVAAGEVGDSSM